MVEETDPYVVVIHMERNNAPMITSQIHPWIDAQVIYKRMCGIPLGEPMLMTGTTWTGPMRGFKGLAVTLRRADA